MITKNCSYLCACEGIILPIIDESPYSPFTRSVLYLTGLLYSFVGVAIAAEVFMTAIERITTTQKKIKISKNHDDNDDDTVSTDSEVEPGYRLVNVWNPTVANLTLMALGSSAPEILLSCIEVVGKNFEAGALGPGTIVGSAAFNLLVIPGVCICAIPSPDIRRIDAIRVFLVTATFSVFAYVWLLVILLGTSQGEVHTWEALLTFLFGPILVLAAYITDKKFLCHGKKAKSCWEANFPLQDIPKKKRHLFERMQKEAAKAHPEMTPPQLARLVANQIMRARPRDRLLYRFRASKFLQSNHRLSFDDPLTFDGEDAVPSLYSDLNSVKSDLDLDKIGLTNGTIADVPNGINGKSQNGVNGIMPNGVKAIIPNGVNGTVPNGENGTIQTANGNLPNGINGNGIVQTETNSENHNGGIHHCTIEFSARRYAFTREKPEIKVRIIRTGRLDKRIIVRCDTDEDSAKKNQHFLHKSESLAFQSNEVEKTMDLQLIPEAEWSEKEKFFVRLTLEEAAGNRTKIGSCNPAVIRFSEKIGDPVFELKRREFPAKKGQKVVRLPVEKTGGSPRKVGCVKWRTEEITARDGKDFVGGTGELRFEEDEVLKFLDVVIFEDKQKEEEPKTFMVHLQGVSGSSVGPISSGLVTIAHNGGVKDIFTQMDRLIPFILSKMEPGATTWRDQIIQAVSLGDGEGKGPTCVDICNHILSFPFKVVFALVPPPNIMGAWPAFFISLGMIGLITAIVGDLAGIFGCLVGLNPDVTAISLVALGTSLPDTFASRIAAIHDTSADNAIGNVTGSNSVNVFLGLGLPWLMAAVYHEYNGRRFKVIAGALGFSVAVYSTFAVICIVLLMVRRSAKFFGRGELGGPTVPKWGSAVFCFILWFLYVVLSALQSYCHIPFPGYSC